RRAPLAAPWSRPPMRMPAHCWPETSWATKTPNPVLNYRQFWRTDMDKDRVKGAAHRVKGAIKEGVGKVTGDAKTEAEGAAEKTAGKVQNAVGGAKDAGRDSLKK